MSSTGTEWFIERVGPYIIFTISVVLMIIFAYHCYIALTNKATKKPIKNNSILKMISATMEVTQYLIMIAFLFHILVKIPLYLKLPNSDSECYTILMIVWTTWPFAKSLMYILWWCKTYTAFHASSYAYPKSLFIVLLIVWFGWVIFMSFALAQVDIVLESVDGLVCATYYPKWEPVTLAIVDIIFSFVSLSMFISPLFRISSNTGIDTDSGLLSLIQRYTLLTLFAVISSLVAMIIYVITDIGFLYDLDAIINVICILYMSPLHRKEYKLLCGPTEKCCCSRCGGMSAIEMLHTNITTPRRPTVSPQPQSSNEVLPPSQQTQSRELVMSIEQNSSIE